MLLEWLRYRSLLATTRPRRYANLFRTIHERRCRRLVEIGTWNGVHAEQMIRTAAVHAPIRDIRYRGFDLFEDLSEEELARELSKRPPSYEEVLARLRRTGADVRLFRGNTRVTLPQAADELRQADFVFIDGGHSIETITSDWNAVRDAMRVDAIVVFDDYYVDPGPELLGLGCQTIIAGLDRGTYRVELLEPCDAFAKPWGLLKVRMARVGRR
jgi:predicted O-methyltransferase YrrM